MIQFTEEERKNLRRRAERQPEVVACLKESVREVMERPVRVPATGIANWTHYYYCPKCSVQLEFDWEQEGRHRCPECGTKLLIYDNTSRAEGLYMKCRTCKTEVEIKIKAL